MKAPFLIPGAPLGGENLAVGMFWLSAGFQQNFNWAIFGVVYYKGWLHSESPEIMSGIMFIH